jgi:hypothetical protein
MHNRQGRDETQDDPRVQEDELRKKLTQASDHALQVQSIPLK